jgi:hypothetical protein
VLGTRISFPLQKVFPSPCLESRTGSRSERWGKFYAGPPPSVRSLGPEERCTISSHGTLWLSQLLVTSIHLCCFYSEHLFSKHISLSSNPSTIKTTTGKDHPKEQKETSWSLPLLLSVFLTTTILLCKMS